MRSWSLFISSDFLILYNFLSYNCSFSFYKSNSYFIYVIFFISCSCSSFLINWLISNSVLYFIPISSDLGWIVCKVATLLDYLDDLSKPLELLPIVLYINLLSSITFFLSFKFKFKYNIFTWSIYAILFLRSDSYYSNFFSSSCLDIFIFPNLTLSSSLVKYFSSCLEKPNISIALTLRGLFKRTSIGSLMFMFLSCKFQFINNLLSKL